MQLLCGVLSEVNIIHINGFVIGIIETDRFIIAAVARNVMVKVVSAYLLKLQDFGSFVKCLPWFTNEIPACCLTNDRRRK